MTTEERLLVTGNTRQQEQAALPRFRLQLTAAERKLLLVLGDLVLLNCALLFAVVVWNKFEFSPQNLLLDSKWFVTLSALWLVVASVLDMYNLARAGSAEAIARDSAIAAGLTSIAYVFVPWLTPPIQARMYVFGFVALAIAATVLWREIYARALLQPNFCRRILVLGARAATRELIDELTYGKLGRAAGRLPANGYQVVGFVADSPALEARASEARFSGPRVGTAPGESHAPGEPQDAAEPRRQGELDDLVALVHRYNVDEIVVARPAAQMTSRVYELLLDCRELGVQVTSLSSVYERLSARLPVEYAHHDPTIILDPSEDAAARLYLSAKRLLDLLFSLAGLAALAVLAPFVALGNALWSPGPLFYQQERVGKGGCPFRVVKFRSMRVDAERSSGAVWCDLNDPRITPLGRWLRKLRLDELPQVVNVFRGEMSMVGPRPERPQFVGELARQLPLYRARHAVKPGITGWAQVQHGYANSVEDSRIKLEYDLYYVKHASLALDLQIILQTVAVMLTCRGI